jgi:hypothetical protein
MSAGQETAEAVITYTGVSIVTAEIIGIFIRTVDSISRA